jgi:hypothetical protein
VDPNYQVVLTVRSLERPITILFAESDVEVKVSGLQV